MVTGRWEFKDGQWQGPLWPIKGLYYACVALVVVIAVLMAVLAGVSVVALWMA